jgi:hypothetical protein
MHEITAKALRRPHPFTRWSLAAAAALGIGMAAVAAAQPVVTEWLAQRQAAADRAAALTRQAQSLLDAGRPDDAEARAREGLTLAGRHSRREASLRLMLADILLQRSALDAAGTELDRVDWLLGPHTGAAADRARAASLRAQWQQARR